MSSDYMIYELLDLLSKDNLQVTINSSDAAEKLSLSLSWMLREIDEDSSLISSFLSKGILCRIKFFLQFFSQLSAHCEFSPDIFASFENILEILNSIADTGIQTKCTVVLQFAEDLVSYITNQLLPFHFRLKVVKYTNLLFERCPTYVKDCLYAKPSYQKHLKNTLKLISSIGDYEFQVGIIECIFRVISKQKRIEALNILCSPEILSSILTVEDENFEADCRRVLNAFNSQQGANQRVFSIPCLEVTLGKLQLHKPKDDNYKEFWIDFNISSKRISFYCCQIIDNEDPQETNEDIWETICILKDYVQEISSNDDDEVFTVQFAFLPLSIELIPGFTLEKFSSIKMLFKDRDAVMKAIQEIFCSQKCSVAKNQICVKEIEKPPKILFPSSDAEQDLEINTAPSLASSQLSIPRSVRKSSVPSEIMSSQNSTDGRYCEVGAIRICHQLPTPEALNGAFNPMKFGSSQMSRSKVNKKTAEQKQEKLIKNLPHNLDKREQKQEQESLPSMITAHQPHNQFNAVKNENVDPQKFESPYVPVFQNLEELKKFRTSKTGECQVPQMRKQGHSGSKLNVKEQSVFVYSSADEGMEEAIPPTLEPKLPSKDSIQGKKLTSTSIHASKTSSYKQNKNQLTSKNSDNSYSNITTRTRSNQTKSSKQSPVAKKQTEIMEENLKEKGKNELPQNPKITLPEKKERCYNKTQSEKDVKPNNSKEQSENLAPSPNHNTSSNNGYSVTDKESTKAQRSFISDSVSVKKSNSDGNISSKRNSNETSTTGSRKGRRLGSFEKLDLLPQNYPLPKDVKAPKETSKKKSPFEKKNPSTLNNTAKQLEEDKVTSIKETQPEPTKADEVTLIPESFPQQNDIDKPEENQTKDKPTGPTKFSSKKKLAVDSGISSSNNSPACVNDLPSTVMKKRFSYSPPSLRNQRNLSSKKQNLLQSSSDKKPLPKKNSFNGGKINNEKGKNLKTLDSKNHKYNSQIPSNKSISKEKEESSYQFPSLEVSPLKTISQDPCCIPITKDNLSKFNKVGQKTLAKELDERIEEFVIASCQNLSEESNTSPFHLSTEDEHNKNQSVTLKRNSQQSAQNTMFDQTNGNKDNQDFAENDPLPNNSCPKALSKSPSVVTSMKEQLNDESHKVVSSEQKANNNEVVYQAIKLGPVSALLENTTISTTKSKQVEQPGNLVFPSIEKDQVSVSSRKNQPLTNLSKIADSAKPSFGGKENKNPSKTFPSPTEKLFKASPSKRRSLNLPLKRDKIAAKVYEKKDVYDPYDFESSSSVEGVKPTATCPRFSSLLTPKKKRNSILSQNSMQSAPQLHTYKGKETLPAKHTKSTPEDSYKFEKERESTPEYSYKFEKERKSTQEDPYKFEKEGKKSRAQIHDSNCDSPLPKKRSKAKMAKSKVTANTSLPPLDLPKINPVRASVRKRKDMNYKEMSNVDSSSTSSFPGPPYEHKQKKKNIPVEQSLNFLHNNSVTFSFDQEDQMEDTAESPYNTSYTQQSEISWINPKKSKSRKIQVEKTYTVKKQRSYYGSYACIPKRKRDDSPKGKTRRKTKKAKDPVTRELSPTGSSHNAPLKLDDKTNDGFSPKSFGSNRPQHPKNIYRSSHDQASHKFSLSSDLQMNKKTKRKKACIKEAIFSDSIEIQRADSFVMFPEDSRCSINISKTEFILQEGTNNPVSSFSNKSISDLEITLSSTEDPKLHQPTLGADNSILILNDESIISHSSKLRLTPSPFFTIDDLKSNSDKLDKDINDQSKAQLEQAQDDASFKDINLEDISHSTPVKEHNIELSPLICAGGDYKSKTSFRKSLFSDLKLDNSDESKKSSLPSPIGANSFLFPGSSSKKVGYSAKVNFCPSPLSISDKSANMDSNDDSSSDSSHEESSRNDIRSNDFLLQSAKSPHHLTALSMTHDDDIKNIVESFTEDMKKSILTKRKGVAAVVEEVLKGTQKALNKICEQDVLKRSDVHQEFDRKIQLVMNELEASTMLYEEHKKKLLDDFQEQTKHLQKIKNVQQKSLGKLKMINSLYHQTLTSEGNSSKAQHQVQNVMKNQMYRLQSKLLDQARQQEMQQVKNRLCKMLL